MSWLKLLFILIPIPPKRISPDKVRDNFKGKRVRLISKIKITVIVLKVPKRNLICKFKNEY